MNGELLSVVIPTYNRAGEVIERAIESVLAQTYSPIEIIVIDDNRDEAMSEALRQSVAKFPGVRLAATRDGHGAQAARNTGIALTAGRYMGFLDDDDEWLPTLAQREIELLESRPDAGMAYCMGYIVDECTVPPTVTNYCETENFRQEVNFDDMLLTDRIGTTTQAILRRSAVERVGGFDPGQLARQDYEMWLRITRVFPAVGVPERLFNHTIHSGEQISKGYARAIQGLERVYQKYAADYKTRLGARENMEITLAGLYRKSGNEDAARAYERRARKTKLLGGLKLLRNPARLARAFKERVR